MKGTIIKEQNFVLTIASEQGLYQVAEQHQESRLGWEAEFTPQSKPAPLKPGRAELISCREYCFTGEHFWVSRHMKLEGYRVLDCPDDPYLAAEGASLQEAFEALKALALEYRANALLELNAQFKVNYLCGRCLFKLSARAARIAAEDEIAESCRLALPVKIARVNSPNRAQQRYLRVLSVCALLIFSPILLRLWGSGQLQLWGLGAGLGLLCLAVGFTFVAYFPTAVRAYLLRARKRLTI